MIGILGYVASRLGQGAFLPPFVALAGLLFVVGCGKTAEVEPYASASGAYHVDRCGGFTGRSATMGSHCDGEDEVLEASCDVIGGELEASSGRGSSWSCSTTWTNADRGGAICVHLTCRHVAVSAPATDAGASVNMSITCAEADGAAVPCFGP